MKRNLLFLVLLLISSVITAQSDLPQAQQLNIEASNNLDIKSNPKSNTSLSIPAVYKKESNTDLKETERVVKMLPDGELKQAGHDLKLDTKVGERSKSNANKHFGDMYLGDIKTSSKFIGVVCRDHEYVDGDRVKVSANGMVIEANILLTGSFKGINMNLDKGFNRLDFEALNQGSSGPNTAQVDVYDEKGQLIYSNKWLLSTGSKASLIVVQE
ncbi:MAG: hypothetical protein ACR2MM_02615 [Flavobacteriaceae bacterium]